LFLQALSQKEAGDNGAIVFAKTLSGAAPEFFAEALQRTSHLFFLFLREDQKLSTRKAPRVRRIQGGSQKRVQKASDGK
jgi:hypothetical protein